MAGQRLLGQDVIITPFVGGVPQEPLTDIKNFEVAFQVEVIREGYLGQFTDRRDDVYRGVRGSFEANFATAAAFQFVAAILDRARRTTPDVAINIQATLLFPNGDRPLIVSDNAFFNEIPLSIGGRTEFASMRFDWEADDVRLIGI